MYVRTYVRMYVKVFADFLKTQIPLSFLQQAANFSYHGLYKFILQQYNV